MKRIHRGSLASLAPAALAALLLAAPAAPATAQRDAAPTRTWLGLGVGAGPAASSGSLAAVAQLVYQRRASYLALHGAFLGTPASEAGEDTHADLGALYGRAWLGSGGHAALAAGLALTGTNPFASGSRGGNLGVPLVAEAAFQPLPVLGLGIQAFADLNRQKSFGGVVALVQLGRLAGGADTLRAPH